MGRGGGGEGGIGRSQWKRSKGRERRELSGKEGEMKKRTMHSQAQVVNRLKLQWRIHLLVYVGRYTGQQLKRAGTDTCTGILLQSVRVWR